MGNIGHCLEEIRMLKRKQPSQQIRSKLDTGDDVSVLVWGTPSEGSKEEVAELFGPSSNLSFTEYREQPILFSGKLAGIKERERKKYDSPRFLTQARVDA